MIKLLPIQYHKTLIQACNKLFEVAHSGKESKSARTICLNKGDTPAPSTNQLRPISMLPRLSKIYARLFLMLFNSWTTSMSILPAQQSGARPHQSTASRVNSLLHQIRQSHRYNTFAPVVYIDFQQAFDKLWHEGLILKLNRLDCTYPYMAWIVNYFSDRPLMIDYGGLTSAAVQVKRGAPQGSYLGPVMYIVAHHGLPSIFNNPEEVHAYVDDFAIWYTPSIHLNHKSQTEEVQKRKNVEMQSLLENATIWHQPVIETKTEFIVHHTTIQTPKLEVRYNGVKIVRHRCFKYLGYHIDSKLSFLDTIETQLAKARKAYSILKFMHLQFPMAGWLKTRFFLTYIKPHLIPMASIFFLFSTTGRERVAAHYRRCMRTVHSLFQCPTSELHWQFKITTLDERLGGLVRNRLRSIQLFEPAFVEHDLQAKNLSNILHKHYREKRSLQMMPNGRPDKRLVKLLDNGRPTLLDLVIASTTDGPWSQPKLFTDSRGFYTTSSCSHIRLPLSVCHLISFSRRTALQSEPVDTKTQRVPKKCLETSTVVNL